MLFTQTFEELYIIIVLVGYFGFLFIFNVRNIDKSSTLFFIF